MVSVVIDGVATDAVAGHASNGEHAYLLSSASDWLTASAVNG